MANNNDSNEGPWVEERLKALDDAGTFQPDAVRARDRIRELDTASARRAHRTWTVAAIAGMGLMLLAMPWPRAAAQRLWDRLSLGRVEIVQISRPDLPESLTEVFTMRDRNEWKPEAVRDVAEAERVAGFRPSLPPPGVLSGTPRLSVVRSVAFTTLPLRVADIERALAVAGITDITVPMEWEGTTLTAEGGPLVAAEYPDSMVEVMQSPPFRMNTPPGFQFGRFMETAFRVFGRNAHDARTLAKEIAANPALVMHFPEHHKVREVALRSGRGVIVGDLEGFCFFWNTADRIYIVAAATLSEEQAVTLANAITK
jgi:hypothetical protein